MKWFREKYRQVLQRACRRELLAISDEYPHTRESLIQYYDHMMIRCIEQETKAQERMLGICLSTVKFLEQNTDHKPS